MLTSFLQPRRRRMAPDRNRMEYFAFEIMTGED
jgi:hypothetical protein